MVIINKILTTHPLYFVRFIPVAALLFFTACGGDDFANKPLTVTPNEHVIASPVANEPPIIILSPNTSSSDAYTPTKKTSKPIRKKTSSIDYNASNIVANSGNYAVQIGAFSSNSIANKAAKQAQQQASSLLASAKTDIDTIQKNGKPLYRVKLTGLSAYTAAQACSELKQKQLSCIITQ
ncbi:MULTISPECIES: SPOR domain-containing protein [Commensalibacter]|uniref:Transglycosylase SLT family protein n=2 Tax=Commensalibacter TaxID=1079922 RepID=W7E847_9PROT|nr:MULTISPECIES: SPOR domain-containing protein [Commensalibacter]EUK19321.1 transglycosylase SLT family protein [Commensalibacter papalotli (ex Servin-Garciduenas et al. 2014)]CAI3933337.1 Soluble lytic murein transglycosylase or regulatory protein s (may contain LysM/invasin domain) (MltE) (PDB:153L) [Commensalibacter papalotli (ex Botero et al. 2024)]CAI3949351.1 Soluble lytic murein transglycosylase or regulatory protein s (may contain LysM/invasin domain) (MltE) (PDB:153L) [Commensalibacter